MRFTRRRIGGWLALAGLLLGAGVTAAASPSVPPPAAAGDGSVTEAGRGLYVANCASCHGPSGQGTAIGPSLVNAGAAAADFYLRTGRMPLGAPGQQPVRHDPVFDEQQIEALVAYVASLGTGPPIPQVQSGGDLHEGWRLYTANCAACHAATGSGNAVGGGYVAVGLSQADAKTIAEAVTIGPGAMPRFDLDQSQRDAIIAYVDYLHHAPSPGGLPIGGFGPVAEGFIAVVVGLVLLVLVAMFVGRRSHAGEPGGLGQGDGLDDDDAVRAAAASEGRS